MTEMPEKYKKLRDEASEVYQYPDNELTSLREGRTHYVIFNDGFNKCYEIMAEEFDRSYQAMQDSHLDEEMKVVNLQQQLKERDSKISNLEDDLRQYKRKHKACVDDVLSKDALLDECAELFLYFSEAGIQALDENEDCLIQELLEKLQSRG